MGGRALAVPYGRVETTFAITTAARVSRRDLIQHADKANCYTAQGGESPSIGYTSILRLLA